jgi:hypothetical protein
MSARLSVTYAGMVNDRTRAAYTGRWRRKAST